MSNPRASWLLPTLLGLLIVAAVVALGVGAYALSPGRIVAVTLTRLGLASADGDIARDAAVLGAIRLPRVLAAMLVGAGLGAAGSAMQGLLRTPLVEPGLIGVSSGAAVAAAAVALAAIPLAAALGELGSHLFTLVLTGAAGVGVTALLLAVSSRRGEPSVLTMLLVGIAINSFAAAAIAVVVFADPNAQQVQATFWLLGSLGGASWLDLAVLAPVVLGAGILLYFKGTAIDSAVLGATVARSAGVDMRALRLHVAGGAAIATAAATSVAGVVAFLGLLAPMALRPLVGAAHRRLIVGSALLGALVMVTADLLARVLFVPTELPVGVLVASVGAPAFLVALLREQRAGRL